MAPKLTPTSVAIVVKDRKKALKWYTQKLGLKRLANEGHWVVVGQGGKGTNFHLCEVRQFDKKAKLEKGNTGIMITFPGDMLRTYEALKAKGVKFPAPPEKTDWGWYCMFQDPDGNEFWLSPQS